MVVGIEFYKHTFLVLYLWFLRMGFDTHIGSNTRSIHISGFVKFAPNHTEQNFIWSCGQFNQIVSEEYGLSRQGK